MSVAGCKDSPAAPPDLTPPSGEPNTPQPTPPGPEPIPVSIFDRLTPSFFGGLQRYVFYNDSTFALQGPFPDFPGKYSRADSLVTFHFAGWSPAGALGADGILRGDSLIVKYSLVMLLSDFEDGVFLRTSGGFP